MKQLFRNPISSRPVQRAFTLIELIIVVAIIGIIAIGLAVDAPRELLNTEKKDRLANFILSEIRTITVENITGKLSETSGSGVADKTRLVISTGAIVRELLKVDSDKNEQIITSKSSLEAPFFGSPGYKITKVCGYYGTGAALPSAAFIGSDTVEISIENRDKKTEISYSGGLNASTGCGNPCKLGIVEMQISY